METSKDSPRAYHPPDVPGTMIVSRAALLATLAVLLTTATACRQIAGLQDQPQPCADPLMIDDMEDGDPSICRSQGRQGAWFSFGDGTSSNETFAVSAISGRGSSRRGVHFTGGGFTSWGAILGLNLNSDGVARHPYGAPNAGGFTFWMKSTVPVTVEVLTEATVLVDDGGQCTANASPSNCNDHFGFQIAAPDTGWKQYQVPFGALRQLEGGSASLGSFAAARHPVSVRSRRRLRPLDRRHRLLLLRDPGVRSDVQRYQKRPVPCPKTSLHPRAAFRRPRCAPRSIPGAPIRCCSTTWRTATPSSVRRRAGRTAGTNMATARRSSRWRRSRADAAPATWPPT